MNFEAVLPILIIISLNYCCTSGLLKNDEKTKLASLKSLIFNNAQATIKLNSSALKSLIGLSRTGTSQKHLNGVGFSVVAKAKSLKLGAGQTVKYDGILTNDGNGYDDRTGVFTCPVEGTYLFVVDALSPKPIWLHIYVNKDIVASLHVSGFHPSGTYLQISRTVILKLKRGDHVKIVNDVKRGKVEILSPYSSSKIGFSNQTTKQRRIQMIAQSSECPKEINA